MARYEIAQTANIRRADGTIWGPDVLSTVYTLSATLMNSVREHAQAAALMLRSDSPSSLAIDSLARASLEAASTAFWILQYGLTGRQRAARLYVVRRSSASRFEQTAAAIGVPVTQGIGSSIADIDTYYRDELELRPDIIDGNWRGCESQHRSMKYTVRVAAFLSELGHEKGKGIYGLLCGSAHGEFWRIIYGYKEESRGEVAMLMEFTPRECVRIAIGAIVESLIYPLASAFVLLGRGASILDLVRGHEKVPTGGQVAVPVAGQGGPH